MAKSVVEDCSEEKRRSKAYKWYKRNAKPTKNNMCLVVDALGDTGISRRDIDLLPWNPDNTKIKKEEMKAPKEKKAGKTEKADKKDKKKEALPTGTDMSHRSKTEKKKDKEKAAEKEKKKLKKQRKKEAEKYIVEPNASPSEAATSSDSDLKIVIFNTVIFEAGPLGMQLEPTRDSKACRKACRAYDFFDGNNCDPLQARMSGKINMGDVIVSVNGIAPDSYESTIALLEKGGTREIVFRKGTQHDDHGDMDSSDDDEKKDAKKALKKKKKTPAEVQLKDKKAAERSREEGKQEREDSLTSLDISKNSNHSSDAGSDHGCQDFTRHDKEKGEYDIGPGVYADQDEQHRTYKVEEEHKRKREIRRQKSELAKQKSKAEADERDKKEKDKKATEFASREPKFFTKRPEQGASYDDGVEDLTKFESKDVEFAQALYAEQKRTYSLKEELKRKREELRRKKEERRRLREEGKEKSMPKSDEVTEPRQDDSLERAFKWYTRMAMPSREEFKRQVEIQRVDITAEHVDLLEWNAAGTRVTNISAMNNLIRTRMLKEATKATGSQRRRQ
jgi:hypothetical protein